MRYAVSRVWLMAGVAGCAGSAAMADVAVFPTTAHAAHNFIPFGVGTATVPVNDSTMHQVFASTLFSTVSGGMPVTITSIGFASNMPGAYTSNVAVRMGYTTKIPGVASGAGGLAIPTVGGGGAPNASGAMTDFYVNATFAFVATGSGTNTTVFDMQLPGSFVYNPALGNLLVEIVNSATFGAAIDLAVSRSVGSAEASRAYATTRFANAESPGTSTRFQFTYTIGGGGVTCYANCDNSTIAPCLNVNDFTCFLNQYAAGSSYANCDASTLPPVLNVNDFTCFLNTYAAGCGNNNCSPHP